MEDLVSCSSWVKDEVVYVDELRHTQTRDEGGGEDAVSAAVALVVGGARLGVVTLCARVAHVLNQKNRLQQRVSELEEQVSSLESSSGRGSVSVGGYTTHSIDSHSLHDSPINLRCGSAPPLKSSECQGRCQKDMVPQSRSSSLGGCDSHAGGGYSPPQNFVSRMTLENQAPREYLNRGFSHLSTRSLNIGSPFYFSRRKYSSISLRRVRRKDSLNREGVVRASRSAGSCLEGGTNSFVTVAEVHSHPRHLARHTESDAVRLLARTLASVLQECDAPQHATPPLQHATPPLQHATPPPHTPPLPPTLPHSPSASTHSVSNSLLSTPEAGVCAPSPLAGCECPLCLRLSADPTCQLFSLCAEGGSLLPRGSRVLVEGDRVGTVIYLGHDKNMKASHDDSNTPRPVGVSVKLWPPDDGQMFISLNDVICQLDDEDDETNQFSHEEFEYLDDEAEGFINQPDSTPADPLSNTLMPQLITPDQALSSESPVLKDAPMATCDQSAQEYFVRSTSVSSINSENNLSLTGLSLHGMEYQGNEDDAFDEPVDNHSSIESIHQNPEKNESIRRCVSEDDITSIQPRMNATFTKSSDDERAKGSNQQLTFFDTIDSAIGLNFTRAHKDSNTEPYTMSDTDRDSPHFGDTWDSGCSVGRGRCKSDSSGQFSDLDTENGRMGSVRSRNLREALELMWAKQKKSKANDHNEKRGSGREKKEYTKRKERKLSYENELNFMMSNKISTVYIDHSSGHSQV